MTLKELRAKAQALRDELAGLFSAHKDAEGKFVEDVPNEAIKAIETKQGELDGLVAQIAEVEADAKKLEDLAIKHASIVLRERPSMAPTKKVEDGGHVGLPPGLDFKSALAAALEMSNKSSLQGLIGAGPIEIPDFDVKTLFSTGAGWTPEQVRQPGYVESVQRQIRLLDLLPTINDYPSATLRYMQETTHTNNAAERAESTQGAASAFAESEYVLAEQTMSLRMIGHSVPVTMEQLEDVDSAGQYLQNRLSYGARRRYETQIIAGDGNAPNIRGLLNFANIRTQAKGADTVDDAFAKAIANVQTNGETTPTICIINPSDYVDFRTGKSATGDPLIGDPRDGYMQPIYGMWPIVTTAVTAGTALLCDPEFLDVVNRRGLIIEMTNSHASDFVNGIYRFRASLRGGIALYRAPSVCQVTGI